MIHSRSTKMIVHRMGRQLASKQGINGLAQPRFIHSTSSTQDGNVQPRKSWVPVDQSNLQKVTTQSLIHEISMQQMEATNKVVPWFLYHMPASYFRSVPEHSRTQHLKAIAAIHELGQADLSLKIDTKLPDGSTQVTFIFSDSKPGALHRQIKSLEVPADSRLSNVKVFSSLDGKFALNIFTFEPTKDLKVCASKEDASNIFSYIDRIKAGEFSKDSNVPQYSELFSAPAMDDYLKKINPSYALNSNPRRFLIQRQLYEQVRSTESSVVHIEPGSVVQEGTVGSWISIAAANVLPEVLLQLASAITSAGGFDISRAHLDTVADPENEMGPDMPGYVTMIRLLVSDPKSTTPHLDSESPRVQLLLNNIRRSKWLDDKVTDLGLVQYPTLGVEKAEIIVGLCSMLHGPLSKRNSQAYASISSILQILTQKASAIQHADAIAQLFLDKFNPKSPLSAVDTAARMKDIEDKLKRIQFDNIREVLQFMQQAVAATLRTNIFNPDRYAFSIRVNPTIMATGTIGLPDGKPLPYGVIFTHGRHFNGFHVRFRDIARGGLRIVSPPNVDQYALESTRQFDEAYGLAHAQQLKNKDIPEGGSKAVILIDSPHILPDKRFFAYRKCVKAFTDSILDLIVKDSVKGLVDLYGKDELIYLGPDEQIIPFDIDWICHRAAQRGYPIPAAFMSSKKGAGINHKEFGVTSEGVVVYLDVALRKVLNIDPYKQPFTIKITGGPDGDVAGNLIKILFREYGNNCKVVGVADGFGVAEDPNGLNADELLRLVDQSLPINSFNASKLSKDGVVMDATTDEGFVRRNTMHFRVKADAFCPAGGRPNTINIDNWKQFLDPETGKPSSPLIVEGANIFTTPEAREQLFLQAGVKIVKDSSANKCGVICSSCEVAASMLLSREEFLNVKPELVADVVVKLKNLARLEAELLFREFSNYPGALPHFSERISNAINKVTDAITNELETVNPGDALFEELMPLIKDNLPKKLATVAWDRVRDRFPVQYQRNAIASTLASRLVYKEGIHLVESQPEKKIAERAFMYYRRELEINKLVGELQAKDLPNMTADQKNTVIDLLRRGGARTSLDIF